MPFYRNNGIRLFKGGSFAYDADCCCDDDACLFPTEDECLCVDPYVEVPVRRVRDIFVQITGTPKFCYFSDDFMSDPFGGGPCDPVAARDYTGLYVLDCDDFDNDGVNPNARIDVGQDTYVCTRFTQDWYVREQISVRAYIFEGAGIRVEVIWTSLPFSVNVGADPETFFGGDEYSITNGSTRWWRGTSSLRIQEQCEGTGRSYPVCADITGQMTILQQVPAFPQSSRIGWCDHSSANTGYVISHVGIGIVVPA